MRCDSEASPKSNNPWQGARLLATRSSLITVASFCYAHAMTVLHMPGSKTLDADPRQQEAIEHTHGSMLVVAGAGTGKTTVLVNRIARLIREGQAKPEELLALTYSDNAAQEMRERVQKELRGTSLDGLQAKTFHAYCNELLQRSGRGFDVLDDQDLWIMLRKRIAELNLKYFVRAANVSQFLGDLLKFMQRCHDERVDPERYAAYVSKVERGELNPPRVGKSKSKEEMTQEESLGRCREIADIFLTVERMLKERNLGTFGHMITGAHRLFREDEELLARERAKARFILVDEFQDANFAQIEILKMLAGDARNVFAVGDPDQAIYRFRGASSAAFKLFDALFPDAKRITLGKNRRSRTAILRCAHALIDQNPSLPSKANGSGKRLPLQSARDEAAQRDGIALPAAPVEAVILSERDAESADIVNEIEKKKKALKLQWKDFAVLYRSHNHRDDIVAELVERAIPFSVENMDVRDTPEVRDLLACMGAIVNTRDSSSLLRVAALPQFGMNPDDLRAGLRALPRDDTSGVAGVLEKIATGPAVLQAVESCRDKIAKTGALGRSALETIIRRFALSRSHPAIETVMEFVGKWEQKPLTATGKLAELVEYLDLFTDAGGRISPPSSDANAVQLMTAHAAKGLEFRHVFIIRVNSNCFPANYKEPLIEFPRDLWDEASRDELDDKELSYQEERRLFYVAMTRACDGLTLYGKQATGKEKIPSKYLRELLTEAPLKLWLRQREASGFQEVMFAEAEVRSSESRTSRWLSMEPASDLSRRLSASSIDAYKTCPLKFKIGRDWKLPSEPGGAMQFGATMHRILLAYYQAVRAGRPLADDVALEIFETDLRGQNLEDAYQLELYLKAGRNQLKSFLETARTSAPTVLHTEEWFDVEIGGARISGRVDRIDQIEGNAVTIVDYKTGKPQDQKAADESLQLSIYAIAAREKWGYKAERLVLYNLVDNQPVLTTRTEHTLQKVKHEVENVAHSIAQNQFDAKPGFHCAWCSYRGLCPATEKELFPVMDKPPQRKVSS